MLKIGRITFKEFKKIKFIIFHTHSPPTYLLYYITNIQSVSTVLFIKKGPAMPVLSMLTLFDTLILLYLFQLCKYHIIYYLDVSTLHAG